VPTKRSPPHHW